MKIVITHNDFRLYYPARLLALQEFLERRGDELHVVELFEESLDYSFSHDDKSAFRHHRYLFPTWRGVDIREVGRRLTATLEKIDPDAVVCGAVAFPAGAVAVRWAARRGRPVVVMDNARRESFPRNGLNRFIKRRIFRHVDAFLCPAPAWNESLEWWGFRPEQIFHGLNVVDNAFWSSHGSDDEGVDGAMVVVGRQVPKKRHIDILGAYKLYADRVGPMARPLVVIGQGAEHSLLAEFVAREGLQDKVTLLPYTAPERLRSYYHRAALLVIASNREETWGAVVNEAMNGGCAIIASDRTGCSSTLVSHGRNGYIFPMGDVEALADAMVRYDGLSEQGREQMASSSRQIISDWGLDRFCEGVTGAIACAMSRSRRGRGERKFWLCWCRNPLDALLLRMWSGRLRHDANSLDAGRATDAG